MTVVGVISMVLGALGVLGGGVMCAMFVLVSRSLRELEASNALFPEDAAELGALQAGAKSAWASAPLFGAGVMVFGVLLMVSGKGLLGMRPWARGLTAGLAWFAIACSVVMMIAGVLKGEWTGGADLGVIYWVLVVVLAMSREWKRAYAPAERGVADGGAVELRCG
jgi:hypothetical protein